MRLAIGADYYAGLELKDVIIEDLRAKGYEVKDCGAKKDAPIDYPFIAQAVAKSILSGECDKGILICGTGIGISIAANKIRGIIAAHCTDTHSARMAAEHNNANVIAIGEKITGVGLVTDVIDTWLNSKFQDGPHKICIDQILKLESQGSI